MARIAFTYNIKRDTSPEEIKNESNLDCDFESTINEISALIRSIGHEVVHVEADHDCFIKLKNLRNSIDLVFNIAEGTGGNARESQVPLYCEVLGIPYTHSDPTVHALSLHKDFAKQVVKSAGIKVPESIKVTPTYKLFPDSLTYPIIIKPNSEGSSLGVFNENVVNDYDTLTRRVDTLFSSGFQGELLVEDFIEGREFTVAVLNEGQPKVLPIVEQRFDFLPEGFQKIAGFELKWIIEDSLNDPSQAYYCPAPLDDTLRNHIENTSLKIFDVLNVKDCARIDYRLTQNGDLYFIEINTLPGLNPADNVVSYFPLSARTAGYSMPQLFDTIIKSAMERYNLV